MLAMSDSWSSASSLTAASSHPVSVADRCSGDRFLRSEKVRPQFSAMASFSTNWSRSHRGTGLRDQ